MERTDGDMRHPLQHRCFESAIKVWHKCDELGLTKSEDEDLQQFIFEFQTTGVKLGGALTGLAQGHCYRNDAFTVAHFETCAGSPAQSPSGT